MLIPRTFRAYVFVLVAIAASASLLIGIYGSQSTLSVVNGYFKGENGPSKAKQFLDAAFQQYTNPAIEDIPELQGIQLPEDPPEGPNDQEQELTEEEKAAAILEAEKGIPSFNNATFGFQDDLNEIEVPTALSNSKFATYPPHNYKGPGHETFATLYVTRNGTLRDPYFLANLNIIYRLLWAPKIKSKHPVTVFVTGPVPREHREWFAAAGAIVREVGLRPFTPIHPGVPGRIQDMFSKLEMWRQTDFSRITYLDSDAFPLDNIDEIFNLAPEQTCFEELLPEEDQVYSSICDYVFGVFKEATWMINAGVMVFKPDEPMYARLARHSEQQDTFDNGFMEQSMLTLAFDERGPFPYSTFSQEWNAFDKYKDDEGGEIKILHDKMWSHHWMDPDSWVTKDWEESWADMVAFFNGDEFKRLRENDRSAVLAQLS